MKKGRRYFSIALHLFLATLLLCISFSTGAQVTVRGVITDDETGERLVGATVVLKETSIGTVTNTDGEFELTVQEPLPFTVLISYVGYVSQELVIDSPRQELNISLNPDAYLIDDVEIKGSRLSEKQKESPLTVESMDIISIK